jgi:DMSO/TMAO reductase YedYZ molybdopterin-dependent catalytic subunit
MWGGMSDCALTFIALDHRLLRWGSKQEYSDRRVVGSGLIISRMVVPPIVFLVVSVVLWQLANAVFMPELLANRLFEILPVPIIERGVQLLGPLAKQLAFANVAIVYFGVYFVFSLYWERLRRVFGNAWFGAFALWGVNVLVLFPIAGKGILGSDLPQGPFSASLFLFAAHWIFARTLQIQAPRQQPLPAAARRGFLLAIAIAVIASGKRAYDLWFRPAGRVRNGNGQFPNITGLSQEITPVDEFYTVSKNSVDPVVTGSDWKLELSGLVANPGPLTMDELRKLTVISMYATLSCISNEVGGKWIGNARWTGVPVASVLKAAGLRNGARDVIFHAADGYTDSIPVERALHPFCILAYEMNDAPLTSTHGFPLRLIVPGIYGMKNVKWITGIELSNQDYRGFWQQRGWDDRAPYKLLSRIDVARDGVVAGIAFGGEHGVRAVEVKVGDQPWRQATLRDPLSPLSWVLWHLEADVKGKGVMVRMIDASGEPQIAQPMPPFPEGSSGLHTVVGS